MLNRYAMAAEAVGADIVLRVTSDCPLIDPAVCASVLELRTSEAARFPEFLAVRHHFDDLARRFRFGRVDLWEALDDDASFADTDHLLMEPAREISQQIQRECFAETD